MFFCIQVLATGLTLVRIAWGTSFYFDGSASSSGSGTETSPFNNLNSISTLTIAPGDKILLKRGTTFTGPLSISTSGTAASRITVGAYGNAGLAKPQVVGGGLNAVQVNGASYVTVENLDISNPGDGKSALRGLYLYAKDAGNVKNVIIQNLYVHDVKGYMPSTTAGDNGVGKFANASGAIIIEAAGTTTPTYFTDVLIQDNEIRNCDRQGIYTWTNWCRRAELASFWYAQCTATWAQSTGLIIQRNRLYDIGGDGIVVKGNKGSLVTKNVLVGFNRRSNSYNAGIWTANSVDSVFQYNTVSGGKSTLDGMSYDIDHSTSGTLFEYNVSHNNEGGFLLMCPYDKPTTNFTVRYNLSVNDRARLFNVCNGPLKGGKIYKNTFVIGDGLSPKIWDEASGSPLDVLVTDNIFRKGGAGSLSWSLADTSINIIKNNFYGSIIPYSNASQSLTTAPGFAAPGLRDPKAYYLLTGYDTLGAANPVADDAGVDFFGNPTSSNNLGFYSGPGTKVPTWISTFDADLSGWTSMGSIASVADPEAGNLGNSAKLSASASLSRGISTAIPFRVNARVWIGVGSGASASVRVASTSNAGTVSFAAARRNEWQILEVTVRAGSVVATLDGQDKGVSAENSSGAGGVTVNSGGQEVWVDDVFVTPL